MAKGFHQEQGIDYSETFSPVVKQATLRVILSLAVHFNWPFQQLYVTNAFLHGILQETIYMIQPPGFVDSHFPHRVCQLHKSLYGLKQAPRAWFERFFQYLLSLGFQTSYADPSLFFRHHDCTITIILLYVDDLIITWNHSPYISTLITQLSLLFQNEAFGQPTPLSGH